MAKTDGIKRAPYRSWGASAGLSPALSPILTPLLQPLPFFQILQQTWPHYCPQFPLPLFLCPPAGVGGQVPRNVPAAPPGMGGQFPGVLPVAPPGMGGQLDRGQWRGEERSARPVGGKPSFQDPVILQVGRAGGLPHPAGGLGGGKGNGGTGRKKKTKGKEGTGDVEMEESAADRQARP
uniref:Uncharacterized protein n=1 Tax=Chromera velia CCMP2878 TaxID=1169474 RepID=A0A0G4EYT3_9ALVE|eukprot:Cvel_14223.t1-p1 / transcript=Cvel_14223.t1 / gene=Cvel_14223 / organism=Chromera_velia_CCMP2878 / gene_product=hypothetical protein / transcript_product=hypothetical protein / location=Cvel_scaffold1003:27703-28236(-) / protein_length=178 / sequence_SO=supercontig / SO=protein_coding / is_pseudo=false